MFHWSIHYTDKVNAFPQLLPRAGSSVDVQGTDVEEKHLKHQIELVLLQLKNIDI